MIRAFFIIRRSCFNAQNKDLARAQVETLDDFPTLRAGVESGLHQRSEGDCRKDVYIAIQVLAVDSYQQVARRAFERVEVPRQTRVTEIESRDAAVNLICQDGSGEILVRGLAECDQGDRAHKTRQQKRDE